MSLIPGQMVFQLIPILLYSMKNFLKLFVSLVLVSAPFACTKPETADFDIQLSVPEKVDIPMGSESMSFRVMFGKAPLATDKIVLGDPNGELHICEILKTSSSSVTFALYKNMVSGVYNVYVQRGSFKKQIGSMKVSITYNSGVDDKDIELKAGNNVYGVVSCGANGVEGVVVSDGVEVVLTDKNGVYQFKSKKKLGHVFISVPSGYEAMTEGVMPRIHHQLTLAESVAERRDFPLVKVEGQDNHTMLFFGDQHLANRTSDLKQYTKFTADVNEYLSANASKKTYAMTLGDMTWELYWVSNKYAFDEYIRDINAIKGLTVFNTIGNHDHDMAYAGDFDTVTRYRRVVAPTYYSFNIGKVHYVVLDDILCKNTGANNADSRHYDDYVADDQLAWLVKDLSHVDKNTPLVVTMHAPLYNDSSNSSLNNTTALVNILREFKEVHVWTGHTHKMYNVDRLEDTNIYEHNAGAVCATWWWTGHYVSGIHVAQDGAPGGYSVMDVTGTSFKWRFKATGARDDYQFRTYDRNQIVMTAANFVPQSKQSESNNKEFEKAAGDWKSSSSDNYVYINVWNYDPKWKIQVTEGGTSLKVESVTAKDPLHLISYNANTPTGGFGTSNTKHMFRVKASSASSTLEIKVIDRFGNIYTETMTRPKKFSTDIYKF